MVEKAVFKVEILTEFHLYALFSRAFGTRSIKYSYRAEITPSASKSDSFSLILFFEGYGSKKIYEK